MFVNGKGETMAISDQQLAEATLLGETSLLDYAHPRITGFVESRGWNDLEVGERAKAVYEYVRDEVPFGYNREETIPASQVLAEGFGQCNTKGTLLMALLRRCGVLCRFHAFTVDKRLQAGVMLPSLHKRLPNEILHSWVEVLVDSEWLNLEGFIVDTALVSRIQSRFPSWQGSFCGFGLGVDHLHDPPIGWTGGDTPTSSTGRSPATSASTTPRMCPYAEHRSNVSRLKGLFWRLIYYRPTKRRVEEIRSGRFPDAAERYVTACEQ